MWVSRPARLPLLLFAMLTAACSGGSAGAPSPEREIAAREPALVAGYDERSRLGLGSPFRLIDLALHDPRLDSVARHRAARAVLDRTRGGAGYQVDPAALDRVWIAHAGPQLGAGIHHLALIGEMIRSAPTPRAGEALVRVGYGLARMEESLSPHAYSVVVHAAALLRDRELARRDAIRLIRAARRQRTSPVELVPEWRRKRRLAVEAPLLGRLPPVQQAWVAREAPVLLQRVRALGVQLGGRTAVLRPEPLRSRLTEAEARALIRAAEHARLPPQSSVVLAGRYVEEAFGLSREDPWGATTWGAILERAVDEERLVGELTLVLRADPSLREKVSMLVLRAGVALRALAQEEPWFPGFPTPTAVEIQQRHGVRVSFAPEVPTAWRPYFLHALEAALVDLGWVLPSLQLEGLEVHVPLASHLGDALASHDPRERVLSWPALTGSGSLAHEIAHDLDWQAARRIGSRRAYASTGAKSTRVEPLARALASLIPGPGELRTGLSDDRRAHATSPPEVLARSFEWFVLDALARRGETNGHLSSALDEVLTGNGSLRPPGGEMGYGDAVTAAVEAVLPVPDSTSRHFRRTYGGPRALTPHEVLRRLSAARAVTPFQNELRGSAHAPGSLLAPLARVREQLLRLVARRGCRVGMVRDPGLAAHRSLIAHAAAARARGVVLNRAREAKDLRALAWLLREFYGPLWPAPVVPDPPSAAVEILARSVADLQRTPPPPPWNWNAFASVSPTACSAPSSSGPFTEIRWTEDISG